MHVRYDHLPHPHIEGRKTTGPTRSADVALGVNGRIAVVLTTAVGTMWCAYVFAGLALLVLPDAMRGGRLALIQWVSQTFIQLVMLSVIMVGQNILSKAADRRAEMTYLDAEAVLHEAQAIQEHLKQQDAALNAMIARLELLTQPEAAPPSAERTG
jgi:hypothetical protein